MSRLAGLADAGPAAARAALEAHGWHEGRAAEARLREEEKLAKDCTFKPAVSPLADQFAHRTHIGERSDEIAVEKRERLQRLAETVRRRITISVLELVPEVPFPVTASAGLTQVGEQDTLDSAVKRGDDALYAAKDAGRDTLLLWQDGKHSQPRLVREV